nr:unnamed protein product [Spirometra erinaceieuropaei]
MSVSDKLSPGTMFLNALTPKFYVALTGTSSFLSGLILIFEWWYFKKYGTSFIEQISLTHIYPLLGGADEENDCESVDSAAPYSNPQDCKVSRNPYSLFRSAEYQKVMKEFGKDPLTYYDMNLSAQDHQTFFTCEADAGKPEYELMQTAWRERNSEERIRKAKEALAKNPECSTAMILLAEEDCSTIIETEKMFKQAYKISEASLRKSQQAHTHCPAQEAVYLRDIHAFIYIRRRLAMCARKLGKLKEAIKIMRENLIECYLEAQQYADAQAFLAKYDDIHYPKSATICYTAALLKARQVADKFSPDIASRRGLNAAELSAVEAIHRAVEFNPHVPKYLLEMKPLILPTEHILKRGDSEAIAYTFFHLAHWKAVEGALNLLHCTWEGTFRLIPYPLEKGNLFYPYPQSTEATDRELLPSFHTVSVYPKKDIPFFIIFTAVLCSLTAVLALLTHIYPEQMGFLSQQALHWPFSLREQAVPPLNRAAHVPGWRDRIPLWGHDFYVCSGERPHMPKVRGLRRRRWRVSAKAMRRPVPAAVVQRRTKQSLVSTMPAQCFIRPNIQRSPQYTVHAAQAHSALTWFSPPVEAVARGVAAEQSPATWSHSGCEILAGNINRLEEEMEKRKTLLHCKLDTLDDANVPVGRITRSTAKGRRTKNTPSTPSADVTAHPAQTHKIQDDNNQRSNDKKPEEKKKSCSKKVEGHEQQIPRNASEEPEPGTSASVSPITGYDMGPKILNLSQKTSDFDENANKTETNEDLNRLQLISSSDHGNHILPTSEHETTVFSRVSQVRGQCLIIQGLPESRASASKERVSADLQLFQCLLNELLRPNEEVSVLKAFRLGKRSIDISEHSRPRPLKIVLANQEQVGLILSRRFRIKDINRGVFSAGLHTGRENKTSTISSGTENKVAEWRDGSCDLQQPDSATPSPNPLDRTDPDEGTVASLNGITSGIIIKRPKTLKLTFFYTNVQIILPKLDELKIRICDLSPDIVSLTETWLSENVDDRELMLPGFQLFRRGRRERQGGGVVTYVKHGLLVSEKTEQFACSAETIWLTIRVPGSHSLEVLTVYRPPRSDPEADARLLEELGRFALRPDVLIMGDFNAPLIDWSSIYARGPELAFDRRFLDMALRSFLTQHVLFHTMAREGQQANCLDLVLTNSMDSIDVVQCLPPLGRSDHVVLQWDYSIFSVPEQPT